MARGEQGEEVPAQDAPQASPQKKIRYPLHLTADSRVKENHRPEKRTVVFSCYLVGVLNQILVRDRLVVHHAAYHKVLVEKSDTPVTLVMRE
jgi:hypothetical protein